MTAKEKLVDVCEAFKVDIFREGEKYGNGYSDCANDIEEALKREVENMNIFPAFGDTVYKLVWIRKRVSGHYLRGEKEHTTLITSDYHLFSAISEGTIQIEKRPFTKTDLTKMGMYVFETEEEAEKALEQYRVKYGKKNT